MKRALLVLAVLLLPGCSRPFANFLDRFFPPAMPAANEPHFGYADPIVDTGFGADVTSMGLVHRLGRVPGRVRSDHVHGAPVCGGIGPPHQKRPRTECMRSPPKPHRPARNTALARDATIRPDSGPLQCRIGSLVRPGSPARKPTALPASQRPARWEVVLRLHAQHASARLVVW